MRDAQVVVLRELFAFAMGIMIMIGVLSIFNTTISPGIQEHSLNEQAYSVLYHIHSLLERASTIAGTASNGTVSLLEDLPDELVDQSYRLFINDSQVCIQTTGADIIRRCINLTVPNVSGTYLSGTDIRIKSLIVNGSIHLEFENYIPRFEKVYLFDCAQDTRFKPGSMNEPVGSLPFTDGGIYFGHNYSISGSGTVCRVDVVVIESGTGPGLLEVYVTEDNPTDGFDPLNTSPDGAVEVTTGSSDVAVYSVNVNKQVAGEFFVMVGAQNYTADGVAVSFYVDPTNSSDNVDAYLCDESGSFGGGGVFPKCTDGAMDQEEISVLAGGYFTANMIVHVGDCGYLCDLGTYCDSFSCEVWPPSVECTNDSECPYNDCMTGSCVDYSCVYSPAPDGQYGDCNASSHCRDFEHPSGVALGDLDGDSILDMAVANLYGEDFNVLLGYGNGAFNNTRLTYYTGNSPRRIALGDLDGDGVLDVVTANTNSHSINVLLGYGDGSFADNTRYDTHEYPSDVALGDLDGDNILDIVTTIRGGDEVFIFLGNGDGTLGGWTNYSVSDSPRGVALGDLDGDSVLDIVTVGGDFFVDVLLGYGDGSFAPNDTFASNNFPYGVALGDLDGDSVLDIVTASYYGDDVRVLLGNGDGSFGAQSAYDVGVGPYSVALGDLDGDGVLDVVTANSQTDDVSVLLGYGDGSFGAQSAYNVSSYPYDIALGDLDGDNTLDVVTANQASDDVSVLLGNGDGTFAEQIKYGAGNVTCACINGSCTDTCGDGECQSWENDSTCYEDCYRYCEEWAYECAYVWFTGNITREEEIKEYCACCGDDPGYDYFYNGSVGVDATYCYNALATNDVDLTKSSWCEANDSFTWFGSFMSGKQSIDSTVQLLACFSSDLDGDGDNDVLSISSDEVLWFENTVGDGSSWSERIIDAVDYNESPIDILSSDLDGDNNEDVVVVTQFTTSPYQYIYWYENDGLGGFGPDVIGSQTGSTGDPLSVFSADLDGDSDFDIITTAYSEDKVYWWENTVGDGSSWSERIITSSSLPRDCFAADLDGDGDNDVLLTHYERVVWFNNTLGDGSAWSELVIDNDFDNAEHVFAVDLDGDGDNDVLATTPVGDKIAWWENTLGDGSSWSEHVIERYFDGAEFIFSADLDNDGDNDILATASDDYEIAWWENEGYGASWSKEVIEDFEKAEDLFAADLDGDGDLEVIAPLYYKDDVFWWENAYDTITGSNGPCCGDDLAESFYTNLIYCANGSLSSDNDISKGFCEAGGHTWFSDVLNGSYRSCCGDDYWWDDFYNATVLCHDGIVTADPDPSKSFCELQGGDWLHSSPEFQLHDELIRDNFDGIHSRLFVADLDGDGDNDVLVAESDNETMWYENTPTGFEEHMISIFASNAVVAADFDGDGDLDVAIITDSSSYWFENTDGLGNLSNRKEINTYADGNVLKPGDIDGDGDLDLIYDSGWVENDGSDTNWLRHYFGPPYQTDNALAADLDGDGDLDVLASSYSEDKIYWFENTDGLGVSWTNHTIKDNVSYAQEVTAADFDGDGDLDIMGTSFYDDELLWFNNTDGKGSFSEVKVDDFIEPRTLFSMDLDGDEDVDLVLGGGEALVWYENNGSANFTQHVVTSDFFDWSRCFAADLDGDGDPDIVTGESDREVVWWRNLGIRGINSPCCSGEADEYFYNGSIGSTTHFCHDGSLINQGVDANQMLCNYYNTTWQEGLSINLSDELIVHYKLDQSSGVNAPDSAGSNDAVLVNMQDSGWGSGRYNNSLVFDGLNDYVVAESPAGLPLGYYDPRSISAWFIVDDDCKNRSCNVWGYGLPDYYAFILQLRGNNLFRINYGTGGWTTSVSTLPYYDDAWHNVVVTFDGYVTRLFLDGELKDEVDNYSWDIQLGNLTIGSDVDLESYFKGKIDDFRFYNRSLSRNEVKALYNNTFKWFTGSITGDYEYCCGDDGVADDFYNGSLNSTNHFCINGQFFNQALDEDIDLCRYYGYQWVPGSLTGSNGPCCGDDGVEDDFYSEDAACIDGAYVLDKDVLMGFCETDPDNAWFAGTTYGLNDACCGDDHVINGYWDNFYNSTHLCYDGIATTNADLSRDFCLQNYEWLEASGDFTRDSKNYSINDSPYNMAVGDLDGDDDLDVVVSHWSDTVTVLLGDGSGAFAEPPATYSVGSGGGTRDVSLGDLDNDGDLDIAAVDIHDDSVSVLLGNGDGTFIEPAVDYGVGDYPYGVSMGDLNNDDNLDLVVVNKESHSVSVLLGYGDGTFEPDFTYAISSHPEGLVLADFDNDGDLDIATSSGHTSYISVLLGYGDGTFNESYQTYDILSGQEGIATGDLDGDGDLDVVVVNIQDSVSVLLGYGDGTFASYVSYGVGGGTDDVILEDFNNDGDLDIATINGEDDNLSILFGNGDGTFAEPDVTYDNSELLLGYLDSGDFDGDGDFDICVAGAYHNGDYYSQFNLLLNDGYSGFNGPCCGDDASEDFNNGVFYCYNGEVSTDGDAAAGACSWTARTNTWFSGSLTGSTGPCCGDDNITDVFYNDSLFCSYGGVLTDADSQYTEDLLGDKWDYASGRGVCELSSNHWFEGGAGLVVSSYLGVEGGPPGVAVGDLDGDGDLDVVNLNRGDDSFNISLNDGNGGFTVYPGGALGNGPTNIALGDLDGDGDLDVVNTNVLGDSISVSFNNGDGSFASAVNYPVSDSPVGIALADLDGDGDLDWVNTHSDTANCFNISLNDGSGGFTMYPGAFIGTALREVSLGDLNSDGYLDIVLANRGGNSIITFLGVGNASFVNKTTYPVGIEPFDVALGDLDGDGDLDIVNTNWGSDSYNVSLNDGNGDFTVYPGGALGDSPWEVSLGDLDGNGDLDAVVTNYLSHTFSVLLGVGDGGFQSPVNYGVGLEPVGLALGDLDGDGDLDVVNANYDSNSLNITFNTGLTGSNGSCCGDDLGGDVFYNDTQMCSYGGVIFDEDAQYVWDSQADKVNYTSGKPVCELKGYEWLSHDNPTFSSYINDLSLIMWGMEPMELNSDSCLDFISVGSDTYTSYEVNKLIGDCAGGFTRSGLDTLPNSGRGIAKGDVNDDGCLDFLTVDSGMRIHKFISDCAGGFTKTLLADLVDSVTHVIVLADLDGNNTLDFVVETGNSVYVSFNDGAGNFQPPTNVGSIGYDIEGLDVGDIDRDGDNDIVVGNGDNSYLYKFLNNGTGGFSYYNLGSLISQCDHLRLGDINGDYHLDIIGDSRGEGLYKVINNGTGGFNSPVNIHGLIDNFFLADLESDNDLDIVVGDYKDVDLLINDGSGNFNAYEIGYNSGEQDQMWSIGVDDFDNDGALDVVAGLWDAMMLTNLGINASAGRGPCCESGDTFVNETHGCYDGVFRNRELLCSDSTDNDADGCTDGVDADCGGTESNCDNDVDDDCDGLTDSEDDDCGGQAV